MVSNCMCWGKGINLSLFKVGVGLYHKHKGNAGLPPFHALAIIRFIINLEGRYTSTCLRAK